MNIIISNADNKPIYEQIYNQIKTQILSDKLMEGDTLPSIRSLAKDLRISVITTKRAYDELEKDGYIYTVAGKGSYIAPKNSEMMKETYLKEIEDYIQKITYLSELCGLSMQDVFDMFKINNMEE